MTRHAADTTALSRLNPGERATIHHISGGGSAARQRLLELGLVRGTAVEFVRTAPLGDPIEIRLRGYHLSLRREEAEAVLVVKLPS